MKKILVYLLLLMPCCLEGQAVLYNFRSAVGTFTPLIGATTLSTAGGHALPSSITFPNGFSFPFFGVRRAQFKVSNNGFLTFHLAKIDSSPENSQTFLNQAIIPSQHIIFNSIPAKTYGDAPFALKASASSGLPVVFSGNNSAVAAVGANGAVTIAGAGRVTITAFQEGNSSYNPASVSQVLVVNRTPQTIVFEPISSKNINSDNFDLTASASSQLPITFTSSNDRVAALIGHTVSILSVGAATITASQEGNANYEAVGAVNRMLVVTKRQQTITFNQLANKIVGSAPFDLTATSRAQLPITYTSSNPAVATIDGHTVTVVGIGRTTIVASQLGNDAYDAAPPISQILTVAIGVRGEQAITFPALLDKTLGGPAFSLHAAVTSKLPISYTSNDKLTISGNRVTMVKAGRASIKAAQAGNQSYNPAVEIERAFCVNPPAPVITVAENGRTLTSSADIGNQWFKDGTPIAGAVDKSYLATENGAYTVALTVDNCISSPSLSKSLLMIGDIPRKEYLIYPNPVRTTLNIDLGNDIGTVTLLSITGEVIYNVPINGKAQVDMKDYPMGIYLVKTKASELVVKKIVKY